VLMRGGGGGGGGGKKGRAGPPPAPVIAGGPPYPGGGYGGPPQNMQGMQGGLQAAAQTAGTPLGPVAAAQGPPAAAYGAPPVHAPITGSGGGGGAPQVIQVKCPNCQMPTMATQGQSSVCFSCGQPLPASITGGAGPVDAPAYPLTGAMQAPPLQAPPSPYAATAGSATIVGAPGQFAILPGAEIKVGRDASQCPVYINEPRVSGVHAMLKFEAARLWARDEGSNNGTWIDNTRIAAGQWVPVAAGSHLRFGPIEFSVRVDT
jgi:hypothetical protein